MSGMFGTVLVANRGEIAVRVIRTLRALGIRSVAVYSTADAGALHTRIADVAVPIGPAPAAHSYLSIERVLEAAARTGAQAVHPGYGFLSENVDFARACEKAGVVFIGPPVAAIEAMADKIRAKQTVMAAGVPAPADQVGLIRLDPVHRIAVLVGVDRNGLCSELVGRAEGTDRDLSAVGDEDLGEHRAEHTGCV